MSERSVRRVRRGYEAFNGGEVESFLRDLDPEFEVVDRPENPDATTYHGTDDWRRAIAQMQEEFADYRFQIEEIVDLGAHVVVVARQSARGRVSGAPVDGPIVHVWDIRDDRAVGMRAYSSREQAFAEEGLA
jgi:ketosteroid isomerase-like protein